MIQYTSEGKLPGYSGNLDLNVFDRAAILTPGYDELEILRRGVQDAVKIMRRMIPNQSSILDDLIHEVDPWLRPATSTMPRAEEIMLLDASLKHMHALLRDVLTVGDKENAEIRGELSKWK